MGKYNIKNTNPLKKKNKKNGDKGPCGLTWKSKKCTSTRHKAKPTSQCKTACRFNNKRQNKILK